MNSLLSGDFRFFWPENIKEFAQPPFAWDSILNSGLGMPNIGLLWINSYLSFTAFFSYFGLSWKVIVLLFWLLPVFLGAFVFSALLFRYLFPKTTVYCLLAGVIYGANTYILMVALGGQ